MRSVIALAIAVGLLGACSPDDPEPSPEPTVEPTTTPEPEPEPEPVDKTPVEPEAPLPRAGNTPDEVDAEIAAAYFVELYEYVMATGDTATWEMRADTECLFCTNVLEGVREHTDLGLVRRGGALDIGEPRFAAFDDVIRIYAVEVPYTVAAVELVAKDGSVHEAFDAGAGHLMLEIGYLPSVGWKLFTGVYNPESQL